MQTNLTFTFYVCFQLCDALNRKSVQAENSHQMVSLSKKAETVGKSLSNHGSVPLPPPLPKLAQEKSGRSDKVWLKKILTPATD